MAKVTIDEMMKILSEVGRVNDQINDGSIEINDELLAYLDDLNNSLVNCREMLEEGRNAGVEEFIEHNQSEEINIDDDAPLNEYELNELAAMTGMKPKQILGKLSQMRKEEAEDTPSFEDQLMGMEQLQHHPDITDDMINDFAKATKCTKEYAKSYLNKMANLVEHPEMLDQTFDEQEYINNKSNKVKPSNYTEAKPIKAKPKEKKQPSVNTKVKIDKQAEFDKMDEVYQELFLKPELTDEELQTISDFYGFPLSEVISQWKQRRLSEKAYMKHQKKRRKKRR